MSDLHKSSGLINQRFIDVAPRIIIQLLAIPFFFSMFVFLYIFGRIICVTKTFYTYESQDTNEQNPSYNNNINGKITFSQVAYTQSQIAMFGQTFLVLSTLVWLNFLSLTNFLVCARAKWTTSCHTFLICFARETALFFAHPLLATITFAIWFTVTYFWQGV